MICHALSLDLLISLPQISPILLQEGTYVYSSMEHTLSATRWVMARHFPTSRKDLVRQTIAQSFARGVQNEEEGVYKLFDRVWETKGTRAPLCDTRCREKLKTFSLFFLLTQRFCWNWPRRRAFPWPQGAQFLDWCHRTSIWTASIAPFLGGVCEVTDKSTEDMLIWSACSEKGVNRGDPIRQPGNSEERIYLDTYLPIHLSSLRASRYMLRAARSSSAAYLPRYWPLGKWPSLLPTHGLTCNSANYNSASTTLSK